MGLLPLEFLNRIRIVSAAEPDSSDTRFFKILDFFKVQESRMDGIVGFLVINWLGWAFVVGYLGKDRELGMGRAVAWSLLFSPLIGLIVTLTSPRADPRASAPTAEVRGLFDQCEKKIAKQDYDEAMRLCEQILDLQPFAPMTNYYLATLYSVKANKEAAFNHLTRAIDQGFKDFAAMNSAPRLAFLRNQPEFRESRTKWI